MNRYVAGILPMMGMMNMSMYLPLLQLNSCNGYTRTLAVIVGDYSLL
jgi:hypothetical protein